jgi:hypothetical protein
VKCPNCSEEVNPTLVYCQGCGAPTDADFSDVIEDEERKAAERRRVSAVREAQELLYLALFLLASIIVLRVVLLKERRHEHVTSFRLPYAVLEDANLDPPVAVPAEARTIKLPPPDYGKN